MYIIAMYDINTETKAGRKRLRKIFKLMKQYLIHIQNSVFEGELTKAKFEELKLKTMDIMEVKIDSVIFFKSRDIKWMDKDICGFEKMIQIIFINLLFDNSYPGRMLSLLFPKVMLAFVEKLAWPPQQNSVILPII